MRDPERIPEVVEALHDAWRTSPDLRLGQLVVAVAGNDDPFHIEEGEWLRRLRAFAREHGQGGGR